jgi:stage II sporulation protein GA (sporulation sigma-E factor processing peptidase)
LTLYVDIIWLLNWLFDCLLLYWTAVIQKRKAVTWRIVAGGLIGSCIIILSFTPLHLLAENITVKLLFSVVMVLSAFGFVRIKVFLKNLTVLYFVTFLAGGILIGLHFMFDHQIVSQNPNMYGGINQFGDPVSWIFVLIGFPLAWQFSKKTLDGLEMAKITYEQLVKVTVKIDDFTYIADGLIDSGNQLYDPITRSPVMVVSLLGREDGVPDDMLSLFKKPEELFNTENVEYSWSDRIRLIPSKVVGSDSKLLTAIKPDLISIEQDTQTFHVKNGFVSFTFQQLSSDNRYSCIVHPKMVTGIPEQSAS